MQRKQRKREKKIQRKFDNLKLKYCKLIALRKNWLGQNRFKKTMNGWMTVDDSSSMEVVLG